MLPSRTTEFNPRDIHGRKKELSPACKFTSDLHMCVWHIYALVHIRGYAHRKREKGERERKGDREKGKGGEKKKWRGTDFKYGRWFLSLLLHETVRWFTSALFTVRDGRAMLTQLDTKFTPILALNEHGPLAVFVTFSSDCL